MRGIAAGLIAASTLAGCGSTPRMAEREGAPITVSFGRAEITVESLYISPALANRLPIRRRYPIQTAQQLALLEANP